MPTLPSVFQRPTLLIVGCGDVGLRLAGGATFTKAEITSWAMSKPEAPADNNVRLAELVRLYGRTPRPG